MLNILVTASGFEAVSAALEWLRPDRIDLRPLADRIAEILVEENRSARNTGIDKDGAPLVPIAASTVARRARRGDGDGPPLAPNGDASRSANLSTQVNEIDSRHLTVVGTWPETEAWMRYHVLGTDRMPARPIDGLTPEMRARIEVAIDEFASELVAKFYAQGGR